MAKKSKQPTVQVARDGFGSQRYNLLIFVLILGVSFAFGQLYDPPAPFTKKDLMRSLLKVRDAAHPDGLQVSDRHVVLGVNAALDVVVDAQELMTALGVDTPTKPSMPSPTWDAFVDAAKSLSPRRVLQVIKPTPPLPSDRQVVSSLDDLASIFKRYSAEASAVERSVSDSVLFDSIVAAADSADVKSKSLLGGNAALMASTFSSLGMSVTLGGQVGDKIAALLPDGLAEHVGHAPGNARIGGVDVEVKVDEVHIIMEFPKGTQWGGWGPKADRANRVIVSKDESNAVLAALEATIGKVVDAKEDELPSLLVLSGIHMLDGREEEFVKSRLQDLENGLKKISPQVLVHLELASIGSEFVLKSILETTLSLVDSIGLNEQELLAAYKALGGKFGDDAGSVLKESDLSGAVPSVQAVSTALTFIMSNDNNNRVLSRIHFHCFSYHIIALRNPPAEGVAGLWKDSASAVAAGSLIASTKACDRSVADLHGNDIDLKFSRLTTSADSAQIFLSDKEPVVAWTAAIGSGNKDSASLVLAPVLSCREPVQTVGLGDAISATALAYQI